ncbi:SIMPL domain-containing protein [Pseudarthrobacter sp. J1763]|uniref:SIMPL domain-containing protein n=1 Tax=Pseudarthrobacter sp. J1763 TaxID=3420445 RepID=UPI003D26FC4F
MSEMPNPSVPAAGALVGPARTITVTGTGSANAAPDQAVMNAGVEVRAGDAPEAYAAASAAALRLLQALRDAEVREQDITTSALDLRAETVWEEGRGQVTTAYVASSTLTVRITPLTQISDVVALVVKAGGNNVRLNGPSLGFTDESSLAAAAREAAFADAKERAEHYCSLAGVHLAEIVSLGETPSGFTQPHPKFARMSATDVMPVSAGESSVTASVTVVWAVA